MTDAGRPRQKASKALRLFARGVDDGRRSRLAEAKRLAVETAQRFAPVLTGMLRDSIRGEEQGDKVHLEALADHAFDVEFGTPWSPAQPFLRPAARIAERYLVDGIVRTVELVAVSVAGSGS